MKTEDYSSGILMQLIASSFERQDIWRQLPAHLNEFRRPKAPHVQLSLKRELLAEVFLNWGAAPIIQAGFDIRRMPDSPLSFTLLKAASVTELLERFFKLQRYFHSKHRVQLIKQEENTVSLWHMSKNEGKPERYEDLLIAGLVAGMLSQFGCSSVKLIIDNATVIMDEEVQKAFLPPKDCSRFVISWGETIIPDRFTSAEVLNGFRNFTATGSGRISGKIGEVVASDPVRKWSVKTVADRFGLSSRTLQRRLKEEGTTFGDCILAARCQCGAYFITQKIENLTAVGFLCGFSDAAHFSREFKRNMGILPSQFQESISSDHG
ncbi:MAG: helix-turn-helix transcriptional regulator [Sneathiella sp.]